MYVLAANGAWNEKVIPTVYHISYARIKEWRYTEKGYFSYELCVPEPPEVTEIVDGSCLVRVKPLDKKCRDMSEKYVFPLEYQGNNLLCSNWDSENLEDLDYNGIYEYLYAMKYGEQPDGETYSTGIPKEEFENGTVTLTVDAVCQMILCNDAVITHELTLRFFEDGSFMYLGNKILNDGMERIPEYQYHINREQESS